MANVKKWNASVQFPTNSDYICRVIGADFSPSSKGNPMLTLEFEVVKPEVVDVGEEQYNIAGVTCKAYYTTEVTNKGEENLAKTEMARARLMNPTTDSNPGLFALMGIDPATVNWDNIDTQPFLGKLVYCLMEADVEERRKNPTAAQIADAKARGERAMGDVMKNPVTGQPLVNYWPKIKQIFGLAPSDGLSVVY